MSAGTTELLPPPSALGRAAERARRRRAMRLGLAATAFLASCLFVLAPFLTSEVLGFGPVGIPTGVPEFESKTVAFNPGRLDQPNPGCRDQASAYYSYGSVAFRLTWINCGFLPIGSCHVVVAEYWGGSYSVDVSSSPTERAMTAPPTIGSYWNWTSPDGLAGLQYLGGPNQSWNLLIPQMELALEIPPWVGLVVFWASFPIAASAAWWISRLLRGAGRPPLLP
ncbi:MAG TPA: hypothetical protein VGS18_00690 [Thermoplasmata archaeon]|nr:hypothetical protein [Thermoplasmata archaeon]